MSYRKHLRRQNAGKGGKKMLENLKKKKKHKDKKLKYNTIRTKVLLEWLDEKCLMKIILTVLCTME